MKSKIIVFAPHPDDETLGCGGVIAKSLSDGHEILIVVLTDGRNAFSEVLGINSEPTPDELKEIRKEELKRATAILGVPEENLRFLDFEDGRLKKSEHEAAEKISEILRKTTPSQVYFPSEGDINPDHRVTSHIVKDCMQQLGLDSAKFQYSIAQKYDRVGPIVQAILDIFRQNVIRVDISRFLFLKEAAVKEFRSQVTVVSSKQQRPIMNDIDRFLKEHETFIVN